MTTPEQFNQAVSVMLAFFAEYLQIPRNEIAQKIIDFNKQLDNQIKIKNEESIQLGQNDQTSN